MAAPPPTSAPSTGADAAELGKLRWRCRRGMKELDVLLARYVDERFRGASGEERLAFGRLLEVQDADLYAYCFGAERPPPEFTALIERITACATR